MGQKITPIICILRATFSSGNREGNSQAQTLNAQISVLFALAVLRNSLASILQVAELCLEFKGLRLMADCEVFAKMLDDAPLFKPDIDGRSYVELILDGIVRLRTKQGNRYPVTNEKEAAKLVELLAWSGPLDNSGRDVRPWLNELDESIRCSLCKKIAELLRDSLSRVVPAVPFADRVHILPQALAITLKLTLDAILRGESTLMLTPVNGKSN